MTKTEAVNAVERFHHLEKRHLESKALQSESDKKKPEFAFNLMNFDLDIDDTEEEINNG